MTNLEFKSCNKQGHCISFEVWEKHNKVDKLLTDTCRYCEYKSKHIPDFSNHKYESIMITGINGLICFTGVGSVWHGQAKGAKSLGVKCELVTTNHVHNRITENVDTLIVFEGNIDTSKFASDDQVRCLGKYIIKELRNPMLLMQGITKEMCA